MLFNLDLASQNIFFNALHVMLHMDDKKFLKKLLVYVQSHNALHQSIESNNHCGLMNISSLIPVSIISLHSTHIMGEFLGLFRRKEEQIVQEKCPHEAINS